MTRPTRPSRRAPRRGEDRGSSAIEMVGAVPVVVVVVLVTLQVVAGAYATHATNQAVRDGARALSMGLSAELAIDRSLPSGLEAERITYVSGGRGVRLEVRVPRVGIFPSMTVDRTAVMPRTTP